MRIISGFLKGKGVFPPAGYKARPTTDFAREALFDILDNEYEFDDLKVLDLFGGTGAISFEFISRGVGHVWCVEMAPAHAAFISSAAKELGVSEKITVVRHNVFDFIPLCKEKFDLVFADPPYALDGLERLPDLVLGAGIMHPGAYFILEHGSEHSFSSHPAFVKERKYGRVHFSFFEATSE
ncbi:MAG: RsmD family RNA methyltransferase [Bacteroidales bacterium]|nr:RsmD family RNA methyltransferase [Bacteroidales bacterium]